MPRNWGLYLLAALVVACSPVRAQEPVLALDPTLMTGWAGHQAAGQKERSARSSTQRAASKRKITASDRALAARHCPRKAEFRRKLGASNRNYRAFVALCAEAGQ